jgi:hypothetical protein
MHFKIVDRKSWILKDVFRYERHLGIYFVPGRFGFVITFF